MRKSINFSFVNTVSSCLFSFFCFVFTFVCYFSIFHDERLTLQMVQSSRFQWSIFFIFLLFFFCFIFAMRYLVQDVEAIHGLC